MHIVNIDTDKIVSLGNTKRNVGAIQTYRADCSCGWKEKGYTRAVLAARAERHASKVNVVNHKED